MSLFKKIKAFFSFKKNPHPSSPITVLEEAGEKQLPWWGNFSINEEQSRFFKIGNIILCLDRYDREWHITSYKSSDLDPDLATLKHKQPFKTFAAQASNEISLKPTLPDRASLSALDRPFYIPVNATLLLYISSPLWIRISSGKPFILLDEIPTETLADTWFGKSTLTGELCYAGRIHCSPRLEDLPRDNTRVITPLLIVNRSRTTLLLQELKVPLPFLSIYSDSENHLWTEQLNVYQEDHSDTETVVIKGHPRSLKQVQLITHPRIKTKFGLKGLFNSFMWK